MRGSPMDMKKKRGVDDGDFVLPDDEAEDFSEEEGEFLEGDDEDEDEDEDEDDLDDDDVELDDEYDEEEYDEDEDLDLEGDDEA